LGALVLVGCGHDKPSAPIVKQPTLPAGTPAADTPEHLVERWLTAYSYFVPREYDTLLTGDFHYHFSAVMDPGLVTQYGNTGWDKAHEAVSERHLGTGFPNSLGTYVPPASQVTFALIQPTVSADPSHADSAAWYIRVGVSDVRMEIVVPSGTDESIYN